MALEDKDRIALGVELLQLRRREAELARHLERSRHRVSQFPSEFATSELRKLTIDHNHVLMRIEELEEILGATNFGSS